MRKLYRSIEDRKIAGVCGGIAEHMDIDPTVVRLFTVFAALATVIFPFVICYILACIIIPNAPERNAHVKDPVG